jgi:MFS-type transporter involved in bile tolerance (Atg22 family)
MSNIFLSSSFVYLASEQAGCVDEDGNVLNDSCDKRVYGMTPAGLIANIAVFSGLLSAFLMPLAGAAVDYTNHRRTIGISVAAIMMLIQAVQIATLPSTWFVMAVLQAVAAFVYQMQVLATYAYLPTICRSVGEATMTNCKYLCIDGYKVSFRFLV